MPNPGSREDRILVFALFGRDAELTTSILQNSGFTAEICGGIDELCAAIAEGAAAVILVEEALIEPSQSRLLATLEAQPAWSDLAIIVSSGERNVSRPPGVAQDAHSPASRLGLNANVTFLERPVAVRSLVSAAHGALRARKRQYQARAVLAELAASVEREKESRQRSEAANQMKDEFLATVSHELRTPLNAILGWTRMLNQGGLDAATQKRGLESVERNAVSQTRLIEDLLDVSRIVSGKLRLEISAVGMREVVEAAIDSLQPALDARKLTLRADLDPEADELTGDPSRIQQVVWNLLANASKFTGRGGRIDVRSKRLNDAIEVQVSDTGEGFDSEIAPYLFQSFTQADSTRTRKYGGLGLGLSICKHIVELHGGTIEGHSDGLGKGARFWFRLPVAVAAPSDREPRKESSSERGRAAFEAPSELHGLKVLLVDDEADARELVALVLKRCGAIPIEAASVAEAMVAMEKIPDLVVSDIGMPKEDGYELIRRIRSLPQSQGGSVPAAALTAFAQRTDERKALSAGFEMHIAKPVEPSRLVSSLANLVRLGRGSNGEHRS